MEVNADHFKNKAGNWQKIVTGTYKPEWSRNNFTPDKKSMEKAKEIGCEYCGEVTIPVAYHPMKKSIKFCSVEHGKLYMIKYPDTRYLTSTWRNKKAKHHWID